MWQGPLGTEKGTQKGGWVSEEKGSPVLARLKGPRHTSASVCSSVITAMKTPVCHKGVSCTAAVWDIVSVQTEGVQQLQQSSPVWVCCLRLSPPG